MKDWFQGHSVEETDPVPLVALPWWAATLALLAALAAALGFTVAMGWWFPP